MHFNAVEEGECATTSSAAFMEENGGNNGEGDSTVNQSRQLSDVELIQEHCIELFSMRDYVMEPQVITTLLAFFQAGGQPERVIELLSGNYQGLGQYANLLGCWLTDLELDDRTMGPSGESSTDFGMPSSSSASSNPPILLMSTDVQRKIESCPTVRNCFEQTVSQMIGKHFSPDAADKIFETEDGSAEGIDWLPELISHRPWRKLIYDLAENFPNCLMLNFAVKLTSDAGFQREISNVNTAAQQLDIFSRVFLSSLEQLLDEWAISCGDTETEAYQRTFAELSRVACHSEQTFLYTQMLLNHVGWKESSKKATICASLAQQLRQSFNGNKEDIAAMHFGIIQSCVGPVHDQCIQAMLTMLSKGLNPADITQLYKAYSDSNSPPPPVVLIRNPFFMEMLIDALFNAINGARRIHGEHLSKYIYLLAYASSVVETKQGNGRKQNRSELESTTEQIQRLVSILYSNEDLILSLDALLHLVHLPILAISLLRFMRTLLLREDLLAEPSQLHFALIDQCAQLHPMLHPRIFKLLCALYDHQSGRNEVAEIVMERQRHIVDRFVHLLHSGMAIPVLERVVSMFKAGQIDVSLVRYFGLEVLDMVEPPYSAQFVAAFLPIVSNREVFDWATFEKHPPAKEFLLYCNVANGGRRGEKKTD